MCGKEYQIKAMRTNDGKASQRLRKALDSGDRSGYNIGEVFNACLGLSGEVGEFQDAIKKWLFHEKEESIEHLKKELGDVMWYVAMMCHAFDWDLDEIMQMNIDKLKARYPEGFDTARAHSAEEPEKDASLQMES